MTRINSGINVKYLTDEHLLAEHREIKRVPSVFKRKCDGIPEKFKLGTGHVKFFVDKQKFLLERYINIREELIRRGYNMSNFASNWNDVDDECMKNYIPQKNDIVFLKQRITDRINNSKKEYFRYYRCKITKEKAIELLQNSH